MQAQAQAQQDQSQNQMNQLLAQAEAQRADAKQREESIRSENVAREELLIRMKTDADRTNAETERVIAENEFTSHPFYLDSGPESLYHWGWCRILRCTISICHPKHVQEVLAFAFRANRLSVCLRRFPPGSK